MLATFKLGPQIKFGTYESNLSLSLPDQNEIELDGRDDARKIIYYNR